MSKLYDVVVKTGTYQKGGETKNRYENIGAMMEGENGTYLLLKRTFNPAGVPNPDNKESVLCSLFGDRDSQPSSIQQQPAQPGGFDDDIGF